MKSTALFVDRPPRPVLGMIGTFVLDRIVGHPDRPDPEEDLGGLAYAVAAAASALPPEWTLRPIARVGSDAWERVTSWIGELAEGTGSDAAVVDPSGLRRVTEPNNRVELRYEDDENRTERLTGGVGPWDPEELAPELGGSGALLVNFISGYELDLDAAETLRSGSPGPVYSDLHSLFLGTKADGTRVPRRLPEVLRWISCFDAIQVNADEFRLMASSPGFPPSQEDREIADVVLRHGPGLLARTEGGDGATLWARRTEEDVAEGSDAGAVRPARWTISPTGRVSGDPTGCGDVWGATLWSRLLAGDDVETAAGRAHLFAGVAVSHPGVEGLDRRLRQARTSEEWTDPGAPTGRKRA